MREKLPRSLGKCPIFEAIFQLRFKAKIATAGEVLPGLLFAQLRDKYPEVAPLPMASVPRALRDKTPELVYQPSHQLRGTDSAIQVGDRVISLVSWNYPGWSALKPAITQAIEALSKTGLIEEIERFSFKYTNVLEVSAGASALSLLKLSLTLADERPQERGFQLRSERVDGDYTTIISISPNSSAKHPVGGKDVAGLLVDVDTLYDRGPLNLADFGTKHLDPGHSLAKRIFFSLLTDETIDGLEPEW